MFSLLIASHRSALVPYIGSDLYNYSLKPFLYKGIGKEEKGGDWNEEGFSDYLIREIKAKEYIDELDYDKLGRVFSAYAHDSHIIIRFTRYIALQNHLDLIKIILDHFNTPDLVNWILKVAAQIGSVRMVREVLRRANGESPPISLTYGDAIYSIVFLVENGSITENHVKIIRLLKSEAEKNRVCIDRAITEFLFHYNNERTDDRGGMRRERRFSRSDLCLENELV